MFNKIHVFVIKVSNINICMINILVVINVYYVNLELMKKVISVCVNMINLYIIYTKINVYYHVGKIIINLLALILKIVKHAQER